MSDTGIPQPGAGIKPWQMAKMLVDVDETTARGFASMRAMEDSLSLYAPRGGGRAPQPFQGLDVGVLGKNPKPLDYFNLAFNQQFGRPPTDEAMSEYGNVLAAYQSAHRFLGGRQSIKAFYNAHQRLGADRLSQILMIADQQRQDSMGAEGLSAAAQQGLGNLFMMAPNTIEAAIWTAEAAGQALPAAVGYMVNNPPGMIPGSTVLGQLSDPGAAVTSAIAPVGPYVSQLAGSARRLLGFEQPPPVSEYGKGLEQVRTIAEALDNPMMVWKDVETTDSDGNPYSTRVLDVESAWTPTGAAKGVLAQGPEVAATTAIAVALAPVGLSGAFMATYWGNKATNDTYQALIDDGHTKGTAGITASFVGPLTGLVEMLRIPGLSSLATDNVKRTLSQLAKDFVIDVVQEGVTEEFIQAGLGVIGEAVADELDGKGLPSAADFVRQWYEDFTEAMPVSVILSAGLSGAAISTRIPDALAGEDGATPPPPQPPPPEDQIATQFKQQQERLKAAEREAFNRSVAELRQRVAFDTFASGTIAEEFDARNASAIDAFAASEFNRVSAEEFDAIAAQVFSDLAIEQQRDQTDRERAPFRKSLDEFRKRIAARIAATPPGFDDAYAGYLFNALNNPEQADNSWMMTPQEFIQTYGPILAGSPRGDRGVSIDIDKALELHRGAVELAVQGGINVPDGVKFSYLVNNDGSLGGPTPKTKAKLGMPLTPEEMWQLAGQDPTVPAPFDSLTAEREDVGLEEPVTQVPDDVQAAERAPVAPQEQGTPAVEPAQAPSVTAPPARAALPATEPAPAPEPAAKRTRARKKKVEPPAAEPTAQEAAAPVAEQPAAPPALEKTKAGQPAKPEAPKAPEPPKKAPPEDKATFAQLAEEIGSVESLDDIIAVRDRIDGSKLSNAEKRKLDDRLTAQGVAVAKAEAKKAKPPSTPPTATAKQAVAEFTPAASKKVEQRPSPALAKESASKIRASIERASTEEEISAVQLRINSSGLDRKSKEELMTVAVRKKLELVRDQLDQQEQQELRGFFAGEDESGADRGEQEETAESPEDIAEDVVEGILPVAEERVPRPSTNTPKSVTRDYKTERAKQPDDVVILHMIGGKYMAYGSDAGLVTGKGVSEVSIEPENVQAAVNTVAEKGYRTVVLERADDNRTVSNEVLPRNTSAIAEAMRVGRRATGGFINFGTGKGKPPSPPVHDGFVGSEADAKAAARVAKSWRPAGTVSSFMESLRKLSNRAFRPFAEISPLSKKDAAYQEWFRLGVSLPESVQEDAGRAIKRIFGTVDAKGKYKDADPKDALTAAMVIITRDMYYANEDGQVQTILGDNGITLEQAKRNWPKYRSMLEDYPGVKRIVDQYDKEMRRAVKMAVDAGVAPSIWLEREGYWHRMRELRYDAALSVSVEKAGVRDGFRKPRSDRTKMSKEDIAFVESELGDANTNIAESAYEVIHSLLGQIAKKKHLDELEQISGNKMRTAMASAERENVSAVANRGDKEHKALERYRNRVVSAWDGVRKAAPGVPLPARPMYDYNEADGGAVVNWHDDTSTALNDMLNGLYGDKAKEAAQQFMQAVASRGDYLRRGLGSNYKTYRDFIPEGYAEWTPTGSSRFYVPLVDRGMRALNIKDAKVSLAMPGRTMLLPENVVRQLNDPSMHHSSNGLIARMAEQVLVRMPVRLQNKFLLYAIWRQPGKLMRDWLTNMGMSFTGSIRGSIAAKYFKSIPEVMNMINRNRTKWDERTARLYELGIVTSSYESTTMGGISASPEFSRFTAAMEEHLNGKKEGITKRDIDKMVKLTDDLFFSFGEAAAHINDVALKVAAYDFFVEEYNAGRLVFTAGALKSTLEELVEKFGVEVAAAHWSRNLGGDYANLTGLGKVARKIFPYWAWTETTIKSESTIFANSLAAVARTANAYIGQKGTEATGFANFMLKAGALVRPVLFLAAVETFNMVMRALFNQDRDDLAIHDAWNAHMYLGPTMDGENQRILRMYSRTSDLFDWFNAYEAARIIRDGIAGQIGPADTTADLATSAYTNLVNRVVSGIRSDMKLGFELTTGLTLFPDFLTPRPITPDESIAGSVGARDTWLELRGTLLRDGSTAREGYFDRMWGVADANAPYMESKGLVSRFKEVVLGEPRSFGAYPPAESRKMELAYYANDYEAFKDARRRYVANEKTLEDFAARLDRMDPMYGLAKEHHGRFYSWMTPAQRDQMGKALEIYANSKVGLWMWYRRAEQEELGLGKSSIHAKLVIAANMYPVFGKQNPTREEFNKAMTWARDRGITLKEAAAAVKAHYSNTVNRARARGSANAPSYQAYTTRLDRLTRRWAIWEDGNRGAD